MDYKIFVHYCHAVLGKCLLAMMPFCLLGSVESSARDVQGQEAFRAASAPINKGEVWHDDRGEHINAHGGGVLFHEGTYYWYGEHRTDGSFSSLVGVNCYSSDNLTDWKYRSVALPVSLNSGDDIEKGCIIERPKVIYNEKTGKFVMWFHLELKGRGYEAARYGVAVSDSPVGPFRFVRSGRVNAGIYPIGFSKSDSTDLATQLKSDEMREWWTPQWRRQIERGMFTQRDYKGGQMSRDMTLFVDDDSRAYHIYSSEDNLTIQIAQLTDDYEAHNGSYVRVAPGGQNEAPSLFKKDGVYWMITSGCTGWTPNKARMFRANNIFGPWHQLPNPCRGEGADKTFGGQSTYVLKVAGGEAAGKSGQASDRFVFMADVWNPSHLNDSRYIWLPITFEDGIPVIDIGI